MEYRYVGISSYGYDGEISMKQGDEGIVSNGMYRVSQQVLDGLIECDN